MQSHQITMLKLSEEQLQQIVCTAVERILKKRISEKNLQLNHQAIWLSRQEAANQLQISLPSLDKLARQGKITAHRLNRKILYNQSELNEAIAIMKIKFK